MSNSTTVHFVASFSMDLNGNAITVSNDIWDQMKPHIPLVADGKTVHPISASSRAPVVESYKEARDASATIRCPRTGNER